MLVEVIEWEKENLCLLTRGFYVLNTNMILMADIFYLIEVIYVKRLLIGESVFLQSLAGNIPEKKDMTSDKTNLELMGQNYDMNKFQNGKQNVENEALRIWVGQFGDYLLWKGEHYQD